MTARGKMVVSLACQDHPGMHRTLAMAGVAAILAAGVLAFGLSL